MHIVILLKDRQYIWLNISATFFRILYFAIPMFEYISAISIYIHSIPENSTYHMSIEFSILISVNVIHFNAFFFNEQRRDICAIWIHTTYYILLLKFVDSNFRIVRKIEILIVCFSIKISQKRRQSSYSRTHLNFLRQDSLVYNFLLRK